MCITGFLFHIVWSFEWEIVAFLVLTVHVGLAIRLGEKVGIGLNFGYISHKTDKVVERKQKLFKSVDKIEKRVKKNEKKAREKQMEKAETVVKKRQGCAELCKMIRRCCT